MLSSASSWSDEPLSVDSAAAPTIVPAVVVEPLPCVSSGLIRPATAIVPATESRPTMPLRDAWTGVIEPAAPVTVRVSDSDGASSGLDENGWKPIGQVGLRVKPPEGPLPTPTQTRPEWYSTVHVPQGVGGSRVDIAQAWNENQALLEPPMAISVNWAPTELWYKPLYFEDANLERYGYRYGIVQPVVSAAHFFGRVPLIPYMRGVQPAGQEVAALGYQRPGSPVMVPTRPTLVPHPRGALYQAGATVGGVFIVP